ncbi:MAG: hypothetical protein QOG85_2560 [Gaiellaceae bacterium]|jgi:hypothetical protein|nr:hypothetical protein [Gaiellaceae bacterium]
MKRAAIILCTVLLLAACGGGSSAEDQIKAAYLSYFSPSGSLEDHAAFLEDGTKPDSPIQATHFSNLSGASVSNVTLQSASRAKVTFDVHYSIYHGERVGYAVLQDGKWKVASETVCQLVAGWGSPWPSCTR